MNKYREIQSDNRKAYQKSYNKYINNILGEKEVQICECIPTSRARSVTVMVYPLFEVMATYTLTRRIKQRY
jgi:hypothetical protein